MNFALGAHVIYACAIKLIGPRVSLGGRRIARGKHRPEVESIWTISLSKNTQLK